jgi:hypothetical protein
VAKTNLEIYLKSRGLYGNLVDCRMLWSKERGSLCNCSEDFLVLDLFSKGKMHRLSPWLMDHSA